jgi:hypothetical protein
MARKAKVNPDSVQVGDTVTWKAAGKVARAEGSAGKIVSGKVITLRPNSEFLVTPYHRLKENAMFPDMDTIIGVDQILDVFTGP